MILFFTVGCGAAERRRTTPASAAETESASDEESVERVVAAGGLVLTTGTESVEHDCSAEREEVCNGLDDDCDGILDEDCPYTGGQVHVVATWPVGPDVDLYVVEPEGDTLSFQRGRSVAGGVADHSGRGRCRDQAALAGIENVAWPVERPPVGTYAVILHYWGECGSVAGPVPVTVSVAIAGVVQTFRRVIAPNERVVMARFEVL